MSLAITVRNYARSDREECRRLWRELTEWHREVYQDHTIGGEHPEDYFDEHLARVGAERIWVATHNSKVVGVTGLIIERLEGEIEPLIVSRDYRGKGVGKQLAERVVTEARKKGLRFLKVRPASRNIDAIRFFYEQGFTALGQIELFMDFSSHNWKSGPKLFGHKFRF